MLLLVSATLVVITEQSDSLMSALLRVATCPPNPFFFLHFINHLLLTFVFSVSLLFLCFLQSVSLLYYQNSVSVLDISVAPLTSSTNTTMYFPTTPSVLQPITNLGASQNLKTIILYDRVAAAQLDLHQYSKAHSVHFKLLLLYHVKMKSKHYEDCGTFSNFFPCHPATLSPIL